MCFQVGRHPNPVIRRQQDSSRRSARHDDFFLLAPVFGCAQPGRSPIGALGDFQKPTVVMTYVFPLR